MRHIVLGSLLVASSLLPLAAVAGPLDFTPDPSRAVSDPAYLPTKGQIYGATGYNYQFAHTDTFNSSTGNKTATNTIDTHTITQNLAYGVMDRLTLRLGGSYSPSSEDVAKYPAGTSLTRNSDGFSNPNLGVTYRVLDQQQSRPVSADVSLDFAPDIFDNDLARVSADDGTVARGGSLTTLGAQVSHKTKSFTIAGLAGVQYYGDRRTDLTTSTRFMDADAHWGGYVGAITQTRFTDRVSLDLGARYTLEDDYGVTRSWTTSYTKEPGGYGTFGVGVNCHIIPNRLVASLTYDYNLYQDVDHTYANPVSNTRIETSTSNVFGVRLQYAFR